MRPDSTRTIPLPDRQGRTRALAVIDDGDLPLVANRRWFLAVNGYAVSNVKCDDRWTQDYLHRFLFGLAKGDPRHVDHINGDRLDNRRSNLRLCPRGDKDNHQNQPHLRSTNRSGYRGVSWCAWTRRWRATAKVDGHYHDLGRFATSAEADEVAKAFRRANMPFARDAA